MKENILNILKDGNLIEKELRKLLWKECKEEYPNKEEFDEKMQSSLKSLLNKEKVVFIHDQYSLASKNKRPLEDNTEENNKKAKPLPKSEVPVKAKKVLSYPELWKTGEQHWRDGTFDEEYLRTNPEKITRLFCGNLNKKITEEDIKKCISGISFIKWITDKTTGEFYGSTFLEMEDPVSAAAAVMQDKSKFMGRPLKIYYCPPRPGDQWPPQEGMGGRGNGPPGGKGTNGPPKKEKTPKPPGSRKLYAGNLSYNIDDETIMDFFKDCGTMTGLRWLTHKGSEEFRGCGFIEFSTTEEADEAMKMDGKELLGRNIILDWTN